jgi:hypothetical protein
MNLFVSTNPFCELCLAIPEFRKAVQQNNRRSAFRPCLHDMQADAVGFNMTMFQFHGKWFCLQTRRDCNRQMQIEWLTLVCP